MPSFPRLGDPTCPSWGTSSAPRSPQSCGRVRHWVTHVEVTPRVKSPSPWVSEGFAGSKPSSPPPPAGCESSPCPGAVRTHPAPAQGCHQHCRGGSGPMGTLAGTERASHRPMPPQHGRALGSSPHPCGIGWDPDFSHSFRLSPQRAGWPRGCLLSGDSTEQELAKAFGANHTKRRLSTESVIFPAVPSSPLNPHLLQLGHGAGDAGMCGSPRVRPQHQSESLNSQPSVSPRCQPQALRGDELASPSTPGRTGVPGSTQQLKPQLGTPPLSCWSPRAA